MAKYKYFSLFSFTSRKIFQRNSLHNEKFYSIREIFKTSIVNRQEEQHLKKLLFPSLKQY
jgi:hypothetical protein